MSPAVKYKDVNFRPKALAAIAAANEIIAEYAEQGFDLTLRQLFYQFVSRGLIPNTQREYKNLGSVVNDGRLAGLIDWNAIVDRTRNLRSLSHWDAPSEIIQACARQFRFEHWADQPRRVEVWIEKDALVGVIEGVCTEFDVPFFSCRGYTSQSELWGAAQRLLEHEAKECIVLHLGDHDPSGVDMSRDIQDRLDLFEATHVTVRRIALNADQVARHNPPPNPAKITDSRARAYIRQFGRESWELDALDPKVIDGLIRDEIRAALDLEAWNAAVERTRAARAQLAAVSERWADVAKLVGHGDQ